MKVRRLAVAAPVVAVFAWAIFAGCVGDSTGSSPDGTGDASGSDGPAAATDGSTSGDAGAPPDASADAPADASDAAVKCSIAAAFTSRKALTGLSSTDQEYTATLPADELSIFFGSNRAVDGGNRVRVWTASRATRTADFGAPTLRDDLSSAAGNEGDPTISPDGKTIVFWSDRDASAGVGDLFESTRANVATVFTAPAAIANVNSTDLEITPSLRGDGNELFFASNRSGAFQLYHSRLVGSGFEAAALLGELSGAGTTLLAPAISADGLTLYFSASNASTAEVRLWVAERASVTSVFGNVRRVTEIDLGTTNAAWLSPDQCRLYVTESAGDSGYNLDLVVYERMP